MRHLGHLSVTYLLLVAMDLVRQVSGHFPKNGSSPIPTYNRFRPFALLSKNVLSEMKSFVGWYSLPNYTLV